MSATEPVDRFVTGALGEPGHRTFLVEIADDGDSTWYILEKLQVVAFVAEARRLLTTIGFLGAGAVIDLGRISEPDEIAFRVAGMELAYDEENGMVTVTLISTEPEADPAVALMTPAQLDAAARVGAEAVEGGRPRCPRCGLAMDPEGHACPANNGDLRHHRP